MTPIQKAESALNRRIEQIQANLREPRSEAAQQFLFQSLVVCVGLGEALTDYLKMIGQYAQGRHGELKQTQETLTVQHAQALQAGTALLERLKANPTDRALRKEIEQTQKTMEGIQKTLRRGANSLQREVAPSLAMIDTLALSVRRLGEAEAIEALKRATKGFVGHARDLYRTHPGLPSKDVVDAPTWENAAAGEIDRATDFYEAYACAGYQALLALDLMTMAVSPAPPRTPDEATQRANDAVAARVKAVTARFTAG